MSEHVGSEAFFLEAGGFVNLEKERGIDDRLDTTWGHSECHVFLAFLS